jgi:cell division protein ZipA
MKYFITILVILLLSLSLFWWNRHRRRKSRMAKRIAAKEAKESSVESAYLEDSTAGESSSSDSPNPLFAPPIVDDAMEMSEQQLAVDGLEAEAGDNSAPLPVKNIESTLLAEHPDRTDGLEALAGDQVDGVATLAGKKKEDIPVLKEDSILALKKIGGTSLFEENSASLALKKQFAELEALAGQPQDGTSWSSDPTILRPTQGAPHALKPSAKSSSSAVRQAELIIVLYVVTQHSGFPGPDIFDVLADLGFRYGEKKIFHHYGMGEIKVKKPVFSVANMLEPGIFDPQHLSKFVSPGLALFMRLPGPFGGRVAFELLLNNAQQIAELLEGSLEDEKHEPLSLQAIGAVRERIANFEHRETPLSLRKRVS